ncbi:MAG: glycosyltransferase [Candidatus Desulfofervidaceae bacterium]|nr:glycosyltransferase [Candidatus Desulfofervidaceae bacterium]
MNSMVGGGAERVVQLLLEQFVDDGSLEIVLVLLEDHVVYPLPETVKVVRFASHLNSSLQKFMHLFMGAKRLKELAVEHNLSITLSFLERSNFVNVLAKLFGSPSRVFISEHTNPERSYHVGGLRNAVTKFLLRVLYARASTVVAVSSGVKSALATRFGIEEDRIQVIHDPCDISRIERLSREPVEHSWFKEETPIILTAGRLTRAKGQERLIRAFAKTRREMVCRLVILGDGERRRTLEQLVAALGLNEDVAFLGWQENPYKYMKKARIFALSSLWEGFGIVLVEAMACRVPVVSFDCESGPREILENGADGLLVPVGDEEALSSAMLRLLRDVGLRDRLAQKGWERAKDFSVERIAQRYRALLLS